MRVIDILDQLSIIYGQPTSAIMEQNDATFQGPYLATSALEVLFHCIENCAKIALLGRNPNTDYQLINNVIRLLLITSLYTRPFEEWDRLKSQAQTWIGLHTMIQEAFKRCLNATAPMADHHGYALALPFQQKAFRVLAEEGSNEDSTAATAATQVAALTYQSQLTTSTGANSSQHQEQQMAHISATNVHIAANQHATGDTLHHTILHN